MIKRFVGTTAMEYRHVFAALQLQQGTIERIHHVFRAGNCLID
jgi:hypothetical protein